MRLVAAFIFEGPLITYVQDLNFISHFNRNSVSELMHEIVRAAVESLQDCRKVFEHPPWQVVLFRMGTTTSVLVTDNEYPVSVSLELLQLLHTTPSLLKNMVCECQNPQIISPMYRIRCQLNEIEVVMHENVDKLIQRSEDIKQLVEKSQRLSESSKLFYKVARKQNQCCVIT